MDNKNIRNSKGNLFQSVKGKILIMGILGIAAAFIIGIVGVTSINKNARISEIVSLVNEISLLQSMNIANDAQYQHYVEEKYLDDTLTNLDEMDKKASDLKAIADQSYAASINSVIENVSKNKTNYTDLKALHSERGYDTSTGKYKEYNDASTALMDSFGTLVNNNDWVEIPWQIDTFEISANPVKVDGKEYTKVVYEKPLPKIGKRNNLSFRVGGTFTYKGDFYIKDIEFKNGSDSIAVDLSVLDTIEKSGDGLGDVEFADFDGGKAIKVTGNYDSANDKWEEISTTISIIDQDINKYPTLKYDIYFDNSVINPGDTYQYGGAITGVYQFAGNLSNLNGMVATYSKHVVEGKDVSSELQAIEGLMANIQENIPQYTTDPSLADASNGFLENQKSIFSALKANDEKALKIKADNSVINTDLSNLCSNIQSEAIAQMNTVKTSVTIIILAVLVISIVVLALILIRVSVGINNSVKSFSSAIDEIANGNISARANETGKDEFALFAMNLNGFMDTLEATMSKVKDVTQVLADSGIKLQESASKTKNVASEINDTISEISKGAGEQAKDIETSSQRIVDIGTNIREILSNVTNLSSKSDAISLSGKEASENMEKLNKSSDSANEAFSRIAEQINKTDESVGKIQDAVSLIASVANQINLLSLNASIEAARAGEAGKGFAVVASEISHLADQTNESTNIIGGIIKDLTEESNRTVTTINEVTEKINEQKSNIDSTSEIFGGVSTGIDFTKEAVEAVLVQAEACEKSSDTVVDLMTNLSAISEENAASAETTSTAMTELNAETAKLAETSAELKELADNLKEDLEFFKIATK